MAKNGWLQMSTKALTAVIAAAAVFTATPVLADEIAEEAVVVEAEAQVAEETAVEETEAVAADEAEEAVADEEAIVGATETGWKKQSDGRWKYYSSSIEDYVKNYQSYSIFDEDTSSYKYYGFDSEGYLIQSKWYSFYQNEYSDSSDKYACYYNSKGEKAIGLVTVDGVEYYFESYGARVYGYTLIYDYSTDPTTITYLFTDSETGKYIGTIETSKTGWSEISSNWYYVDASIGLIRNRNYTINGKTYAFGSDGKLAIDKVLSIDFYTADGDSDWSTVATDKKGCLITNKEITYTTDYGNERTIYLGADGRAANGVVTINGKKYVYSDGSLQKGSYYSESKYDSATGKSIATYYFADKNGLYLGKADSSKTGWVKLESGDYVYFEASYYSNYPVSDRIIQEGSKIYGIKNYIQAKNTVVYAMDVTVDNGKYRYYGFDEKGNLAKNKLLTVVVEEWSYDETTGTYGYKDVEKKYYFDDKGYPATGVYTINGVKRFYSEGLETNNFYGYVFTKGTDGNRSPKNGAELFVVVDEDGNIQLEINLKSTKSGTWVKDTLGQYYYVTDLDYTYWGYDSNNVYGELTTKLKGIVANKVVKINGKTYGFNYRGQMLKDTMSSFFEKEIEYTDASGDKHTYYQSGRYYFDENGAARTGWFTVVSSYGEVQQYYGDKNGRLPDDGLMTYNGKQYLFLYGYNTANTKRIFTSNDGKTSVYVKSDNNGAAETVVYQIKDGKKQTGWVKIDKEGHYGYVKNGILAQNVALTINKKIYGFEYDFTMITDSATSLRNGDIENDYNYQYYRFDSKGVAVTGWYKEPATGYYYYYDPKTGVRACDLTEIDGKPYFFDYDGRLTTNETMAYGAKIYSFDDKGNATVVAEASKVNKGKAGWKNIDGSYYYSDGKNFITNAVKTINGKDYYFGVYGVMAHNCASYVDALEGYVVTNKDGVIQKNGWAEAQGHWYYTDSKGMCKEGYVTIDKVNYYFAPAMLVSDCIEYDSNGDEIADVVYAANKKGALSKASDGWYLASTYGYDYAYGYYRYHNVKKYISGGKLVKGWKKIDGSWYYFNDLGVVVTGVFTIEDKKYAFSADGALLTGWATINGGANWILADKNGVVQTGWQKSGSTWYYFAPENGYMATGMYYIAEENTLYKFSASGKYESKFTKTGLVTDKSGNKYYIKADHTLCTGFKTINGKIYYFDSDGKAYINKFYSYYYFGADGAAVKNTWVKSNGLHYRYYGADGKYLTNISKKIDGTWYYFDNSGFMATRDRIADNKVMRISTSGKYSKDETPKSYSWVTVDGLYYYYEKNSFAKGLKTIGNKQYYFYSDGSMAFNTVVSYGGKRYFVDKSGAVQKNKWVSDVDEVSNYQYEKSYLYAYADGHLATGLTKINGVQYYFNDYGYMCTYDQMSEDMTTLYQINDKGVVKKITKAANGKNWVKSDRGSWYYTENGMFANGIRVINGKTYCFSYAMCTNGYIEGVGYADKNGVITTDGWFKGYDNYYGYMIRGEKAYGAMKIGSGYYYFDRSGYTTPGLYYADGAYYWYEGNNGKRTKKTLTEGWNKINGNYYYVVNGRPQTGLVYASDKKFYYMDSDGVWMTNMSYSDGYIDAKGNFVKNTWITYPDGYKQYFAADGKKVGGVQKINGKNYTFTSYGFLLK